MDGVTEGYAKTQQLLSLPLGLPVPVSVSAQAQAPRRPVQLLLPPRSGRDADPTRQRLPMLFQGCLSSRGGGGGEHQLHVSAGRTEAHTRLHQPPRSASQSLGPIRVQFPADLAGPERQSPCYVSQLVLFKRGPSPWGRAPDQVQRGRWPVVLATPQTHSNCALVMKRGTGWHLCAQCSVLRAGPSDVLPSLLPCKKISVNLGIPVSRKWAPRYFLWGRFDPRSEPEAGGVRECIPARLATGSPGGWAEEGTRSEGV